MPMVQDEQAHRSFLPGEDVLDYRAHRRLRALLPRPFVHRRAETATAIPSPIARCGVTNRQRLFASINGCAKSP